MSFAEGHFAFYSTEMAKTIRLNEATVISLAFLPEGGSGRFNLSSSSENQNPAVKSPHSYSHLLSAFVSLPVMKCNCRFCKFRSKRPWRGRGVICLVRRKFAGVWNDKR